MRSSTLGLILLFAVTATEADAQNAYGINQPAAAPTQPPPNAYRWVQPAPVQQPVWLHGYSGREVWFPFKGVRNFWRVRCGLPRIAPMAYQPNYQPYPPRQ